jgi:hypothetical protein
MVPDVVVATITCRFTAGNISITFNEVEFFNPEQVEQEEFSMDLWLPRFLLALLAQRSGKFMFLIHFL